MDVEEVDGEKRVKELKAKEAEGDELASLLLVEPGFLLGVGSSFEDEGEIFNDILGLPKTSLKKVVREAVETLKLA